MNSSKRAAAEQQLAAYGYTMSASCEIHKGDRPLGVVVTSKGPRFYASSVAGSKLWSGSDVGEFVTAFWFAKRVS